jgi:hypothetical protein
MNTFTVLGYYTDNRQPWATSVEATDAFDAEERAKREMFTMNGGYVDLADIRSVGVVEGEHNVQAGDLGDDG